MKTVGSQALFDDLTFIKFVYCGKVVGLQAMSDNFIFTEMFDVVKAAESQALRQETVVYIFYGRQSTNLILW